MSKLQNQVNNFVRIQSLRSRIISPALKKKKKNMKLFWGIKFLFFIRFPKFLQHILRQILGLKLAHTYLSQLMGLWYLSHRRPAKAQASLHICAVSPEPSLFAHMMNGSRRRVRPKIRHLAPLDGCACVFEERVFRRTKSTIIS